MAYGIFFPSLSSWRQPARKQDLETMSTTQIHRKLRKVGWRTESSGIFSENAVGWQLEDATDAMCENL